MPTRNFPGISFTGAGVPDTVGDVGASHIIQSVNGGTRVQIWDKSTPTPNLLTTFNMDSLGTGVCASGFGDPIVIYDRNADRWVLMEFVTSGTNLCVYVSQTPDPVSGGWYAYSFVPPSFPDYPKLSVWPTDANGGAGSYVVTANAGVAVYAMERGPMLAGNPAGFMNFNLPGLAGFLFETVTPADVDGPTPPPEGAPAVLMRHRDTEVHNGPAAPGDLLEMWHLDVDWVTSANTTLGQIPSIDVAEFSSELCGLVSFSCIDQPNSGTNLDPLREVIMHRLQYMHHDDGFETLVGNFVVDVSGTEQGGIRWFELRRTGGASDAWMLHQEGTYSIDGDSRWMGASAMDQSGNIALAYNVSSAVTFPGLRYTGRVADDPPGVMTAGETSLVEGSNPSGTNRYGDYAAMGLDPEDDCTFWFTGEYNVASTWSTRWASFGFEQCGCLAQPSAPSASAIPEGDNRIDVSWDDADLAEVVEYRVQRSLTPGGPYETVATIPTSTCALELSWTDATPRCGAEVAYNVYRSLTSGFSPIPEDRVATVANATSYVDENALASETQYFYVVRAVDPANAREEQNTIEVLGFPQGPATLGTWLDAGGDLALPKMIPEAPWSASDTGGNYGPRVYKTGSYGANTCAALRTPDLLLNSDSVLSFFSRYDIEEDWDKGEVQVSTDGGDTWARLEVGYPGFASQQSDSCGLPGGSYFNGTDDNYIKYSADLSAFESLSVQLRFLMSSDTAVEGSGWWIDEIEVTKVDTPGACTTVVAPFPAQGLRADRADPAGQTIAATWDVSSCTAVDYNLLYGSLAGVAGLGIDGAECSLGSGGSHTWNDVPPGDIFFLVVGTDGSGTESSWGTDSAGLERNGLVASGECSVVLKNGSGLCP
jgi:hypothetical protein